MNFGQIEFLEDWSFATHCCSLALAISFRKRNEKSLKFWQDTIMLNGKDESEMKSNVLKCTFVHRECCDQHWSCSTPCSRSIFETSLGDRSKLFTFSIFTGKTFSQLHTFSKHQTVIVWIWMHSFPFWTKSVNDVHIHDSQHFHK